MRLQKDYRHPHPYTMFTEPIHYPPTDKSPDEYRVIMTGGSTVQFGNPPLPDLLQQSAAGNNFHRTKVYNFGVISQNSGQELAQLVHSIVDYKPDLVIFYDGGNDILDPFHSDPRPGYPFNFIVYQKNPLMYKAGHYPLFSLILFKSQLIRMLFKGYFEEHFLNLKELRKKVGYRSEPWRQQIADEYLKNILKAERIAHQFDSQFIAFFQPLRYNQKKPNPDLDEARAFHAQDVSRKIREGMQRFPSLSIVDLSGTVADQREDIFWDDIHVNDDYNAVIAGQIFHHIRKYLK